MRSYFDFMNDFNKEEILEGLVSHGMFSEKLPPIFESHSFYEYCKNEMPKFNNTYKESNYIKYESMRHINVPRSFGIPNPMNYYKLCLFISENWELIKMHFKEKTELEVQKVSKIHIRKMKNSKKIFQMNYKNYQTDEFEQIDYLLDSKYLVNVDISTCFPSIYTHSIPWALVGKSSAKIDRNPNFWFNQLDFYTRGINNGETHGILIGPHASNILSEIVLVSVDSELVEKGWKYTRNVDDYSCYVNSYEESQNFLSDITNSLKKYNLILNHKKTAISKLPLCSTERWIRELNMSPLGRDSYISYKTLKLSIDLALDLLQSNHENAAILNYLIKIIDQKELSKNAEKYYVRNILHLSILYPYLIPLIDKYIFEKLKVKKEVIKNYSNIVFKEGQKSNNKEMMCFSIYFSIKYEFEVEDLTFESIYETNHCILYLLGFMYSKSVIKNNEDIKLYKKLAKELKKNKEDFEENWIFIYEVLTFGLLNSDWKILKQNNISFLKNFST